MRESTSSTAPATAAPWPAPLGLRTRFVHLQVAPADLFPVERRNCLGRLVVIGHFHKSEPAGPARLPIRGHVDARNLSERLKQRAQIALGRLETHVAHKQILHALSLLKVFAAVVAK